MRIAKLYTVAPEISFSTLENLTTTVKIDMLRLINSVVERAKADRQRIVLPEGTEERTLKAANQILTDEVADLILLGNPQEIHDAATKWGLGNIAKAYFLFFYLLNYHLQIDASQFEHPCQIPSFVEVKIS